MRVAIAGVWHVHAPDYTKTAMRLGEVVGVYDENPAWAKEFAEKNNIACFASLDELLASDIEGVIVCSASNVHADMMVKIAESGKDIFTEKVLALTTADCLRVKEAVEKAGVRFVVSMPQRRTPCPRTIKAMVDKGEIGKINYIRFRNCHSGSVNHWLPAHFYDKEQCGGGAMIDLGAHGMYLIDWFLGAPESYKSVFTHACRDEKDAELNPSALEDNAVTVMTYADGTIAVNETGFVSIGAPMTLEVGGDRGTLRFADGEVTLCGVSTENKTVSVPLVDPMDMPIESFMKGESPADCDINAAIALTAMMEGAYANV